MEIPRSYIENYSAALNGVSDTAKAALVAALEKVDYTQPVADVRDAVIMIMQAACGASTDVSAMLAAEFYNGLRALMVEDDGFSAVADSMRNPDATEGAVRAFVQVIVDDGDTGEFIRKCAGRLDYENRKAAKECTASNAKNDQLRPKWAVVPAGDETCPFCIILASRGFVYGSEEMASHTHENCECRIMPSWSDDPLIEGYKKKLGAYQAFYDEAEQMRNNPDMPEDLRLRIAAARNKHNRDYELGLVKRKWGSVNELTIIARYLHPDGFISAEYGIADELGSAVAAPVAKLVDVSADSFPAQFSNTRGKRQNLEAFLRGINSVEGADPKMREIFARIGEISESELMPSAFDVKYAAGRGSVNMYSERVSGKITKLTVNIPKMTDENIAGTVTTTAHELGHYIDVLTGTNGVRWRSSEYSDFLRRDYLSMPPSERRAAAHAYSESVTPKGAILEEMRRAGERYESALVPVDEWYKAESAKISEAYRLVVDSESVTSAEKMSAYKKMLKDRKALRREYDQRGDIARRTAMNGVDKLQDIYDALNDGYLRNKVIDGVKIYYGHGDRYYSNSSKKVEEIWANYCALSPTRPDLIDLLKVDQPSLIRSMEAMRDSILEGLNG